MDFTTRSSKNKILLKYYNKLYSKKLFALDELKNVTGHVLTKRAQEELIMRLM